MTDDYAPFPDFELRRLAEWHAGIAQDHPIGSFLHLLHTERARACRDAIESYDALQERCLSSELALMQAKGVTA